MSKLATRIKTIESMGQAKLASGAAYQEANSILFERKRELDLAIDTCLDAKRAARLSRERERVVTDIFELNSRLVFNCVKRFESPRQESSAHDDYVAAGFLGLTRAIAAFSPEKGSLSTWAHRQIMRELLRAVRDHDHPTLSQADFEVRKPVLAAAKALTEELGRSPSIEEVASKVPTATKNQVRQILEPKQVTVMSALGSEDSSFILDPPAALEEFTSGFDIENVAKEIHTLLEKVLSADELMVITHRFSKTDVKTKLTAVGSQLGKSREVARQLEVKALLKLQHPSVVSKLSILTSAAPVVFL